MNMSTSGEKSKSTFRWGQWLFVGVLASILVFFWWMLIYSGGVVLHH